MSVPPLMRPDDPAAADPARRRLLHISLVPRPPSLPPARSPSLRSSDSPIDDILIDDARLARLPDDKDIYRWAVLYENQRGITLFSTHFYSPLSLLPSDPPPFTSPNTHSSRRHLPDLSLDNYPLPDGTWRWVSTAWMVDMRSELGEVQHDGFEYNWLFRDKHWHATVGKLGAAAWVRRRRWIRLMMRPANHSQLPNNRIHAIIPSSPSPSAPSLVAPASKPSLVEADYVWDGSERDWQHVHRLLKQLGRDGRKLELWRMWLGPYAHAYASDTKAKGKQSDAPSPSQKVFQSHLSDVVPDGNLPSLTHLATILGSHGDAILRSFVFPDSRARFVHLVSQAGLAEDLERGLGRAFSASDVDFWSYADNLVKPLGRD